jgi:hypothetical protein
VKKVRVVGNYFDKNFITRATPKGSKIWEDCEFTTEPISKCDYCIFLNNNNTEDVKIECPPENIWMLVQEPYQQGLNDWVKERHQYFGKVFTHLPIANSSKYIRSQTCLPWHIGRTYDELVAEKNAPNKDKLLSAIVGSSVFLPGHRKRYEFIQKIKKLDFELDLFGKGIKSIQDKLEGLEKYMFSFAIENNSNPDMWTEKLADCFLSWTMPIYYGCTNLDKYFPKESFIHVDINSPQASLKTLKEKLSQDFWETSLASIQEARELVLNKYQLFPFLADKTMGYHDELPPQKILIPPYKRSPKARISRFFYKAKSSIKKRSVKIKW